MNIKLNLTNQIIKKIFYNQLYSVKIKIIYEGEIYTFNGIFDEINVNLKTDISFRDNQTYQIIISVVSLGIQILKRKYTFIYHKNNKYKLDEDCSIIDESKTNQINIIDSLADKNCFELKYRVNPLCAFRDEKDKVSIYLNGNVYLISGNLLNIFKNVLELNELNLIQIDNKKMINNLNILIKKGFIIAYER